MATKSSRIGVASHFYFDRPTLDILERLAANQRLSKPAALRWLLNQAEAAGLDRDRPSDRLAAAARVEGGVK